MQALWLVIACAALIAGAESTQDRTITKVVKMLQGMLEKSKEESDKERDLYAKFKCYCDEHEETTKKEIADLEAHIPIVESKIAELVAATNELAIEVAQVNSDIKESEALVEEAEKAREKGKEAFASEEEDLTKATEQMNKAIKVLEALVPPKPSSSFMANKGEIEQKAVVVREVSTADVQQALSAVSVFLTSKQRQLVQRYVTAFLQGTASGEADRQGDPAWEIIKFLKMILKEFEVNTEEIKKTEGAAQETYLKFLKTEKAKLDTLTDTLKEKTESIANNEEALASKREQLAEMEKELADAQEFLAKLLAMCEEKAKQYEKRKLERSNEEAAIAEAIAILNSDEAFASFGKVAATSTGATGLLQIASRRHLHGHEVSAATRARARAGDRLRAAAVRSRSLRLAKVAALLEDGGPFDVVIAKIGEILELIEKEGKNDAENLDWCNSERESYDKDIAKKTDEITTLEDEITSLDTEINDPETGLLAQISQAETSLSENQESQKTQTETRAEEHREYQEDMAETTEASRLLKSAIEVLTAYYKKRAALLQREDPAEGAPTTWEEGSSTAQSDTGNQVIDMLEFILGETKKEAEDNQKAEDEAKKTFDESISQLKEEEANLQKSIVELTETVAEKKVELAEKKKQLKAAKEAKLKMENYLEKIKPGCDFITEHFDAREANRKTEKAALEEAKGILQGLADKHREDA